MACLLVGLHGPPGDRDVLDHTLLRESQHHLQDLLVTGSWFRVTELLGPAWGPRIPTSNADVTGVETTLPERGQGNWGAIVEVSREDRSLGTMQEWLRRCQRFKQPSASKYLITGTWAGGDLIVALVHFCGVNTPMVSIYQHDVIRHWEVMYVVSYFSTPGRGGL
jgi:hypothetical protein